MESGGPDRPFFTWIVGIFCYRWDHNNILWENHVINETTTIFSGKVQSYIQHIKQRYVCKWPILGPNNNIAIYWVHVWLVLLGTIWYPSVPFGTNQFPSVPFGTPPYHSVTLRTIPYPSILFGTIPYPSVQ